MTDFNPPEPIANLLARIAAVATPGRHAYAVGGTVRDTLLGRQPHDVDIAVDGDALAFTRELADALDGHFVALDDENGVGRIVARDPAAMGVSHIDVAQLQGTIEEDLRRRDFTIDALAAPISGRPVIDVCGGLGDLAAGVVRMNSTDVFHSDPLRLLRAARIASELAFSIEPEIAAVIRARAGDVLKAAGERRRDELARIFALPDVYPALLLLDDLRLLDALMPEVTFGRGVTQPDDWHAYDVFEHNLRAVQALDVMLADARADDERAFLWDGLWDALGWREPELRAYLSEEMSEGRTRASLLKLAGLLHDVGKPQTRTLEEGGRIRFLGHGEQGAEIARRIMRRLRFSASEIRFVSRLVEQHLRPVQLAQIGEVPSRRALYRFYRDLGDAMPAVLLLSLADAAASRGPRMTSVDWSRHVLYMSSLFVRSKEEEGILDPPRLIDGNDIMSRLKMPAGPAIGKLLEALREAQAAGEVTDGDSAWAFVREQAETLGTP